MSEPYQGLTRKEIVAHVGFLISHSSPLITCSKYGEDVLEHDAQQREEIKELKRELSVAKGRQLTPVIVYTLNGIISAGHDESAKFALEMNYRFIEQQLAARNALGKELEEALMGLLANIDRNNYRDKAGLRLGDAVPQYVKARQVFTKDAT